MREQGAQESASGVGNDVGHAGTSWGNKVLKCFDGEAEQATKNGGKDDRRGQAALLLKPSA